jgi:signal peptidase I
VVLLVAVVVLTALVQGLLLQSYFVPSAALAPTLEPGDRVLVWKVSPALEPGDVVVVDTTASAPTDRATPVDDGLAGRILTPLAELLGVDSGRQDHLAVVGGVEGDDVRLTAPVTGTVPASVPRDAVVGTAVLRVWPLSRLGTVDAVTATAAGATP